MPAITIEQAYAIAMNAYIEVINPSTPSLTGKLTCSTSQSGTTTSRFNQLFAGGIDLGIIRVQPPGVLLASATPLITAGNTPSNATYTLVTSSTDQVSGIPLDYLVGGQIDTTANALSTVENNIHRTGRAIFRKIKK